MSPSYNRHSYITVTENTAQKSSVWSSIHILLCTSGIYCLLATNRNFCILRVQKPVSPLCSYQKVLKLSAPSTSKQFHYILRIQPYCLIPWFSSTFVESAGELTLQDHITTFSSIKALLCLQKYQPFTATISRFVAPESLQHPSRFGYTVCIHTWSLRWCCRTLLSSWQYSMALGSTWFSDEQCWLFIFLNYLREALVAGSSPARCSPLSVLYHLPNTVVRRF